MPLLCLFTFLACRVFGVDIQGQDCGDKVSHWLTRYFTAEKTYRLVHFEPCMRPRRTAEKEAVYQQLEVLYAL